MQLEDDLSRTGWTAVLSPLLTRGFTAHYACLFSAVDAGCPAAVSNLWDVTDRDIDRFGEAMLQHFLAPAKGTDTQHTASSSGSGGNGGSTKQSSRTKASSTGSSRSSSSGMEGHKLAVGAGGGDDLLDQQQRVSGRDANMSAAISGSRSACRLPHLIGAAPICYGVPTAVQQGLLQ